MSGIPEDFREGLNEDVECGSCRESEFRARFRGLHERAHVRCEGCDGVPEFHELRAEDLHFFLGQGLDRAPDDRALHEEDRIDEGIGERCIGR